MSPETGTALLILVAFVLPSFVTLTFSERTHAVRDDVTPFERLLLTLYYSVLTYLPLALIAWLAGLDGDGLRRIFHAEGTVWKLTLAAFLAILVLPATIATVSRLWLRSRKRARLIERLGIDPGTVRGRRGTTSSSRSARRSCERA